MREILKFIVKTHFINFFLRNTILGIKILSSKFFQLQKFVPISGFITIKVIEGIDVKLYAAGDDLFVNKAYYQGLPEMNELNLFIRCAKHSRIFLDIGANVGLYSIVAAKINSKIKIYSYEPDPFVFTRLEKNIQYNSTKKINIQRWAIGVRNGVLEMYVPDISVNTTTSSIHREQLTSYYKGMKYKKIEVPERSIDEIWFETDIPDLIKLDVEMNEYSALLGMKKVLAAGKSVLFIEIFNDTIKKKQVPSLPENYTLTIQELITQAGYYFYGLCKEGIFKFEDLRFRIDSYNYLVLPYPLKDRFYSWNEIDEVIYEIYN
jgi:FkbM family methyltransferase